MQSEYKERILKKREVIKKMRLQFKENSLQEVTVICERCYQDIAPLKTLEFVNVELHHAKCVFGTLKKVEI